MVGRAPRPLLLLLKAWAAWLLFPTGVVFVEVGVVCCPMVVAVGPTVRALLEAAVLSAGTEAVVDCSA